MCALQFFLALFDPEAGYFDGPEGSTSLLPLARDAYSSDELKDYEAIGRVIVKAVLDGVPLPRGLAVAFFAAVRGDPMDLTLLGCVDLEYSGWLILCAAEEYDPVLCRSVSSVMQMKNGEEIECLCLSFPQVVSIEVSCTDDGAQDDEREVTLENRDEFSDAMAWHHTIGDEHMP